MSSYAVSSSYYSCEKVAKELGGRSVVWLYVRFHRSGTDENLGVGGGGHLLGMGKTAN